MQEQTWAAGTLSEQQMQQIAELHLAAFGARGRTVSEYVEQRLRPAWQRGEGADAATSRVHMVLDDGRPVAKAASFIREVRSPDGLLPVVALAAVASHPDYRGRGLGKLVVQRVFERVSGGEAPLSLFQTGASRSFYERMDCRVVDNRFVDSMNAEAPEARPWHDEVVMIYPGDSPAWPEGTIDLQGPGW